MRRSPAELLLALLLIVSACSSDGAGTSAAGSTGGNTTTTIAPAATSAGSTTGDIASPCDLADADLVSTYFAGTVADGAEGAARNCSFEVEGGDVISVDVFDYGNDEGWAGTRAGFEENRGGTTDVSGIGEDAFYPNDVGPQELIVRAGGRIFSVTVFAGFGEAPQAAIDGVAALAMAIAGNLA